MERKKMIRVGMRITEAIIEILKEEFDNDKRGRRNDEKTQRHDKRNRKSGR